MRKKLESMYVICFYAVTSYTDDIFCNNGNVRDCVMRGTSAHTVGFSVKHSGVHTEETGMFCWKTNSLEYVENNFQGPLNNA